MNTQDEIGNIVAELQRLQIQESQLLQRLDRLNELNSSNATVPPSTTRVFAIGDLVKIKKKPRPLQARQGTIIRIGDTNRITVLARNGTKIIRAPFNLIHVD